VEGDRAVALPDVRAEFVKVLRESWLRGMRVREIAEALNLSPTRADQIVRKLNFPERHRPYANGWLFCGRCRRFIHKTVTIPAKRGFKCPNCGTMLRGYMREKRENRPTLQKL
jgi:DNA-directed RNA polymerase subunit RPC12/RpoP